MSKPPEQLLAIARQFARERAAFADFARSVVALGLHHELPSCGEFDTSRPDAITFRFMDREYRIAHVPAPDALLPAGLVTIAFRSDGGEYRAAGTLHFDDRGQLAPPGDPAPRSPPDDPGAVLFGLVLYSLKAVWQ